MLIVSNCFDEKKDGCSNTKYCTKLCCINVHSRIMQYEIKCCMVQMIKYESNFVCDPWPLTLWAAAALTSASQSLRRLQNAGTRSVLVISGPTAFWSYRNKNCIVNNSTTQSTYLHPLSTIYIFIGSPLTFLYTPVLYPPLWTCQPPCSGPSRIYHRLPDGESASRTAQHHLGGGGKRCWHRPLHPGDELNPTNIMLSMSGI